MRDEFFELWVYLSTTPLLGLTVTLLAYLAGRRLYEASGRQPLLNPVLIAIVLLVALLWFADVPYRRYFEGAQFVHFLLGPATVALAIPLYRHFAEIKRNAAAIAVSIAAGSLAAIVSALAVGWALGASERTLLSLAPKSVTTPVAMGISESIGGLPSLTAVLVILTGIAGAVFGTYVLNALGLKDWRARGLGMGTAAHGIGTARAFQVNELAGAFSSLAMGLNALATAILVPVVIRLLS
jgi:predicted murein hydrolase (TIGR00659 family)